MGMRVNKKPGLGPVFHAVPKSQHPIVVCVTGVSRRRGSLLALLRILLTSPTRSLARGFLYLGSVTKERILSNYSRPLGLR